MPRVHAPPRARAPSTDRLDAATGEATAAAARLAAGPREGAHGWRGRPHSFDRRHPWFPDELDAVTFEDAIAEET
jgi:hypothetical protein